MGACGGRAAGGSRGRTQEVSHPIPETLCIWMQDTHKEKKCLLHSAIICDSKAQSYNTLSAQFPDVK